MTDSTDEPRAVTRLVSATEREAAVKRLTAAFADDAIAVDEFERRVAEVYRAESSQALVAITRDLPDPSPDPSPTADAPSVPAPVERSTDLARRAFQKVDSVLSAVERRVDGVMPECLEVRSILSSVELDLRRADFPPGVTEIRVEAIFGNVEIELPEDVRLEDEGHAFLGTFSVRGRSRARRDEAAVVVRITGRSILSNVEIELDD